MIASCHIFLIGVSPNSMDYAKFRQQLDDFFVQQIDNGSPVGYSAHIQPYQIDCHKNVAQFYVSKYLDFGSVNGMGARKYLLFDMDLQRQLDLVDILYANKKNV